MRVKGVIFDADGPIYYRDEAADNLKSELLGKVGYSGDYKRFKDSYEEKKWSGYVGEVNKIEMLKGILEGVSLNLNNNSLKKFTKEFFRIHQKIKRVGGVLETLKKLKENQIKICVLTDTFFSENEKWGWFENIGVDKYIDKIVCSFDIKKLKDTKEAYQECLKRMKLRPDEVIFVGHRRYEINGAKKANIASVTILPIAEKGIKADYQLQSINKLPELIKNIN